MKKSVWLILVLSFTTIMTACCSMIAPRTPEEIASTHQQLQGSWTLKTAAQLTTIPDNILITLHNDTAAKTDDQLRISGFSGVNHFSGNITVNWANQHLVVGALASTRMMGPEPEMQFEQTFLKKIGQVTSFKMVTIDQLTLMTSTGEKMTFQRGAQ
jgi:heat shock protein HslJ